VKSGDYGDGLLRIYALEENAAARIAADVWPQSMGKDNEHNRNALAKKFFGVKLRNLSGAEQAKFVFEILHGTMNTGKHPLAALWSIFTVFSKTEEFQKVFKDARVKTYVGETDSGVEKFAITNGSHYQKTYNYDIWKKVAKILLDDGKEYEATGMQLAAWLGSSQWWPRGW
jgi:hypothetical protein